MKNLLPTLAFACLLAIACDKNSTSDLVDFQKKTDVTFSISDFTELTSPMSPKALSKISEVGDTLENHVKYLYCLAFNFQNFNRGSISQNSSTTDFGTLKLSLEPGQYKVAFIASTKPLNFLRTDQLGLTHFTGPDYPLDGADIFKKIIDLTVSGSALEQSVRLPRIVSAFNIEMLDVIPDTIENISLTFSENRLFDLESGSYHNYEKVVQLKIVETPQGRKAETYSTYVYETNPAKAVKITAYGRNNTRIVKNVTFNASENIRTKLSGYLLQTGTNFRITVNPIWDLNSEVQF